MSYKKIFLLILFISFIILARVYHLDEYLTLEKLKEYKDILLQSYQDNVLLFSLGYVAVYILSVAINIPGAAILTLAGGALFGLWYGLLLVSLASTCGATVSFLISRYLLRDGLRSKFSETFKSLDAGIHKNGAFYLLSLRLVPLFPFFLINMLMGLTSIRLLVYIFVSWIGMLPGTFVFVNAGTQIASLTSIRGILSANILIALILLGIFPLLAKFCLSIYQNSKIYSKFTKPKKYDYNFIAIGAGAAGLVSSLIGATVRAKVALIEREKMGGDCLNTGCVPSKAILATAKKVHLAENFKKFGLLKADVKVSFPEVMKRVRSVIKTIEPNDSIERYTKLGVDCIQGEAKVLSPFEVQVGGKTYTTRNIILATGAEPIVPGIPGLKQAPHYTSETIWSIKSLPKKLLVLGGGPIGSELAQAYCRLGSKVSLVEMGEYLLPKEDEDVSELIKKRFQEEGMSVLTEHKAVSFFKKANKNYVELQKTDGKVVNIDFDVCLLALGRRARIKGFGLEELGIEMNPNGTVATDEYLQTSIPNILACGDVAGPYQFTHTASHTAWYASVNALFGGFKKFKKDFSVVPWATYTDPEVAHVGLSEKDAKEAGIDVEVTKFELKELDRAVAESEETGFIKVLTPPSKDKILGATVVGSHAGELLMEFVLGMKHGLGLNKIMGTIHPYPSWAEATKFAAGNWKKKHKPEKVLDLLEKFHTWKRG